MNPSLGCAVVPRCRLLLWIAASAFLVSDRGAAENLRYEFDVAAGQPATYALAIEVRSAGRLRVRAEWSGPRRVALRLVPPHSGSSSRRRTGLSPLLLETTVASATHVGTWALQMRAPAAPGSIRGTVVVEVPDPPHPGRSSAPAPLSPAARVAPHEASSRSARAASGKPVGSFLDAVDRLRVELRQAETEGAPDSCHWQAPLLGFLEARGTQSSDAPLTPATREIFVELSRAVDGVEDLRSSRDPWIAGPGPRDPDLAAAWQRERAERIAPLERQLDRLLERLRRDHAPELAGQTWPTRFVSCVMACQRHFEELGRLGGDRAGHRELAQGQWPALQAAAQALGELARLEPRR